MTNYHIALQMALRHPDALKYTKDFIVHNRMKNINKDINDYLYQNFGLDFYYIDDNEIDKYSDSNIMLHKIPIQKGIFDNVVYNDIDHIPFKLPKKFCKDNTNKECLKLSTITDELFRWYDVIHKISSNSMYNLDNSGNSKTIKKQQVSNLHNAIINKKWDSLLPYS